MNWLQAIELAFLSLLVGTGAVKPIKSLDMASIGQLQPAWESPWLKQTLAADPQAEAIVQQYVAGLAAAGLATESQGVLIEVGNYPVAKHLDTRRLPAASLTKIATTLAALETWGVDHRFETLVGFQGTLANGTLQGDLIVRGGGDPLFVWEEGIALGNALQQLGIQRVTGDLIVLDRFEMNFKTDPLTAGMLLKQAMNAKAWGAEIRRQYQTLPPGTPQPQIQIDGTVQVGSTTLVNQVTGWLLLHQSLPLAAVLKAMNIYSNNVMSDGVARTLGGPAKVMQVAHQVAGVDPVEIQLINGSGLGEDNQISARAVVAMLKAIHTKLQADNLTVADVFPIAGVDRGTLQDRRLPPYAALKTGSLSTVSALAGAFPTANKGVVWFAIINYGLGLESLRERQDRLLTDLEEQWGRSMELPSSLKITIQLNQDPYRLGDPQRNQPL
jgi:D-alanyl-D-alanine carboxypeptidase/D-alanyl-D-alanine-endopeptidase (penicillin-binding protein 4)